MAKAKRSMKKPQSHVPEGRSRERGVKLNPEKSTIRATEVSYFGHRITRDGIKPDPAKIAAIRDMEPPKDKGELETILGMLIKVCPHAVRDQRPHASPVKGVK